MPFTSGPGLVTTVVAAVVLTLTTIFLAMRCYVRIVILRMFRLDDYLILFSFANLCAFCSCVLREVKYGAGQHFVDLLLTHPDHIAIELKYWWIGQILFLYATCTVKLSIVIFFCSLQPPRTLRIIAIITACISIMTGLATQFFQMFSCSPVQYFWERANPGAKGSCLSPMASYQAIQVFNSFDIFTDVILALLPSIMVWKLAMRRSKKIAVSVLLGLGGLSAIAAIVRAFYFKRMFLGNGDFTYESWPTAVTSIVEPGVAISVVCIAHLRPLMRQIFPEGWFSVSERSAKLEFDSMGISSAPSGSVKEIPLEERPFRAA